MAAVQSNEASTQVHDTPSSANVEEQKYTNSEKRFDASDHVVIIPYNYESCLNVTYISEEEEEKLYAKNRIEYRKRMKLGKDEYKVFMFGHLFIFVCNYIQLSIFDIPRPKRSEDKLEFNHKIFIAPLLLYMLCRYIYIIVSFFAHKAYITYHAPTENIDLVEKKYFEGRKKFKESLWTLTLASLWLFLILEFLCITESYSKSLDKALTVDDL